LTTPSAAGRWIVPGLDGLRAFAIGLVIVWHVLVSTRFPITRFGPLAPFLRTTWAGVDLFFALSGFLITSLLLREEDRNAARGGPATFSLGKFYLRRTLRILPVFYAVFALLVVVAARFPSMQSVRVAQLHATGSPLGLWPYALFFGNYYWAYVVSFRLHLNPGNAFLVFWSLCIEEHFYLLWPLALRLVKRLQLRLALALGLCILLPTLRFLETRADPSMHVTVHFASHYRIDALLCGALVALGVHGGWLGDRSRRTLLALALGTVFALIVTHQLTLVPHGTPLGSGLGLTALAMSGALLSAELAQQPTSRFARGLDLAPLRVMGRLSYAMYLVHFPMLDLAKRVVYRFSRAPTFANLGLLIALTTLFSLASAWVLHRLVERPFLKLKDRFAA